MYVLGEDAFLFSLSTKFFFIFLMQHKKRIKKSFGYSAENINKKDLHYEIEVEPKRLT